MSTKQSNSIEEIRNEFQKLFEKSPEEQVEHRAQLLSYIFLSEAQKAMDRKGWTGKDGPANNLLMRSVHLPAI